MISTAYIPRWRKTVLNKGCWSNFTASNSAYITLPDGSSISEYEFSIRAARGDVLKWYVDDSPTYSYYYKDEWAKYVSVKQAEEQAVIAAETARLAEVKRQTDAAAAEAAAAESARVVEAARLAAEAAAATAEAQRQAAIQQAAAELEAVRQRAAADAAEQAAAIQQAAADLSAAQAKAAQIAEEAAAQRADQATSIPASTIVDTLVYTDPKLNVSPDPYIEMGELQLVDKKTLPPVSQTAILPTQQTNMASLYIGGAVIGGLVLLLMFNK